jgi:hypothetical protein
MCPMSVQLGLAGASLVAVRLTCFTGQARGTPRPAAEIAELGWLRSGDRHRAAPAVQQVLDRMLPGPTRSHPRQEESA